MTAPIKPTITFAEFEKLDIRVGTIVKVEDVEGSDKLSMPEKSVPNGTRVG